MKYAVPESEGISSANIKRYIEKIEEAQLSTHDIIIARGNNIIFEKYWEPFDSGFYHRMYSVSKSFVSLAIGFLEQDGLLSLDDPICKYFPDELKKQLDENFRFQTVRHMLMMSTAKTARTWFTARPKDRVRFYFENDLKQSRSSGTIFEYDSSGSFVLCALAERLSGMQFMDYLRVKLFDHIGVSKKAYCLKCPGGHSWGDSGILCTPRDLLLTARFVLNKGRWDGRQILNEEYVTAATSKQIDNNPLGINEFNTQGYGYQFWRTYQNSFFFNGMGCQFAICVPDKDIIFVYNGDNQGKTYASKIIIDNFFDIIVNTAVEEALPDNGAHEELISYTNGLKLAHAVGASHAGTEEKVDGVTYILNDNPMGISKMRLEFTAEGGTLFYTNAQGDKELTFGRCENVFDVFPEEGYSDEVGSVTAPGNKYKCASSAAWTENNKLFIKVQIIDTYFGTLNITLSFRDDLLGVQMNKCAEDFLDTYQGYATGKRQKSNVAEF